MLSILNYTLPPTQQGLYGVYGYKCIRFEITENTPLEILFKFGVCPSPSQTRPVTNAEYSNWLVWITCILIPDSKFFSILILNQVVKLPILWYRTQKFCQFWIFAPPLRQGLYGVHSYKCTGFEITRLTFFWYFDTPLKNFPRFGFCPYTFWRSLRDF